MDTVSNNLNEDDTFRRLKRVSHDEMYNLWKNSDLLNKGFIERDEYSRLCYLLDIERFFEKYGWTTNEYEGEFRNKR